MKKVYILSQDVYGDFETVAVLKGKPVVRLLGKFGFTQVEIDTLLSGDVLTKNFDTFLLQESEFYE